MRVTIATADVVGRRMAGPGIRAFHLARELAAQFDVTLVASFQELEGETGFSRADWRTPAGRKAMETAGVLVGQPRREVLAVRHPRAIYDLFDPVVLELEELIRREPSMKMRMHRSLEWGRVGVALREGWRLIAATPRQKDFYLGIQASRGGNIERWESRWLEVPFGAERIETPGPPALPPGPPVIVWGGGSWEWLDPQLAVSAVERLIGGGVPARLLFLGTKHPNRHVMAGARLPVERIEGAVVRNDEWVPYAERGRWLDDARVSLMLHRPTIEAEMSIRTRLFDAIAWGIPVVATRGGWAADLVAEEGLGIVVAADSLEAASAALRRLIEDDAFHASCVLNLERLRHRFAWRVVVEPLVRAIEDA